MSDITQISLNGSVYDLRDKKFMNSVTNCITEIPQDIKLELSNGTLTLKAGSKLYVPNGSGVFDEVTISSDIAWSNRNVSGQQVLVYKSNGSKEAVVVANCFSGTTAPSSAQYMLWYDTTNNKVKFTNDTGSTWGDGWCLPVALVTSTSSGWQSIDQVFNGFGYIGSTIFALPGVKGLIPNGRNTDGTLKSSSFTLNNVLTTTDVSGATGALEYYINGSGVYRANIGTNIYDEYKNIFVNSSGVQQTITALDMNAYRTSGKVSSFTPKIDFRAVDYNDTDFIAHQAMPSSKYVNLTLGASGNTYTAPADGYYQLGVSYNVNGAFVYLQNETAGALAIFHRHYNTENWETRLWLPASKGDVIKIGYGGTSSINTFRFIYANGAK